MSAPIFSVSFDYQNQQLLPPPLRQPIEQSWLYSITYPLQRLHDLIFTNGYVDGSLYATYSSTTTYVPGNPSTLDIGDRVVYINRGVYECIATCSNITPLNTNNWELINKNYIGSDERVRYNSQRILFEYALNRWFQTNASGNWSSTNPFYGWIYIQNNNVSSPSFIMGNTGPYSSAMNNRTSSGFMMTSPFNPYPNTNCFTIWVPIATANQIDPGNTYSVPTPSPNTDNIVRSFADTIRLSGMLYNIQTY